MGKEFWVYHNWTAIAGGRATIHKGNCSFCQDGFGLHGVINDTGEWIGPTSSPRREAKKTGAKHVRDCSFCISPTHRKRMV
jgi:hypothetical protein